MKTVFLDLEPGRNVQAILGACKRENECLLRNAKNTHGREGCAWTTHIQGARGEQAVAQYLDLPWTPGKWGSKDVGDVHQVRTTSYRNGCLLLHEASEDADGDLFWFVIEHVPGKRYEIVGFIRGDQGRKVGVWQDKKGKGRWCYWVDRKHLHPPEMLRQWVKQSAAWAARKQAA